MNIWGSFKIYFIFTFCFLFVGNLHCSFGEKAINIDEILAENQRLIEQNRKLKRENRLLEVRVVYLSSLLPYYLELNDAELNKAKLNDEKLEDDLFAGF